MTPTDDDHKASYGTVADEELGELQTPSGSRRWPSRVALITIAITLIVFATGIRAAVYPADKTNMIVTCGTKEYCGELCAQWHACFFNEVGCQDEASRKQCGVNSCCCCTTVLN